MATRTLSVLAMVLVGVLFAAPAVKGAVLEDPPKSDYHFLQTHWTTENGLPANDVTSIVQTRDGYLWVGTFGGLARFDGVRFHIFNSGNTPGLNSNRLTALYEDRAGVLWIGAENGEIYRMFHERFETLAIPSSNSDIQSLYEDRTGTIWIGTERDGVIALPSGEPSKAIHYLKEQKQGLSSATFICEDREGTVWIGSLQGLVRVRNGQLEPALQLAGLKNRQILALAPHPEGGLYVATNRGIGRFTADEGFQSLVVTTSHGPFVAALARGRTGEYWISYRPTEIFRIQNQEVLRVPLVNDPEYFTRTLFSDVEGNLWMGSNGAGLLRLRKPQVRMITKNEGLRLDVGAGAIVEDHQGSVWFSTFSGLNCYDNGVLRQLDRGAARMSRHWDQQIVGSLLVTRDGDLWVGRDHTLLRRRGEQLTVYPLEPDFGMIFALYEDRQGRLWIGGQGGLAEFREGVLRRFTRKDGLVNDTIQVIMEDHENALWIGTYGGVNRFKDGVFTGYTTQNGLSENHIRDLYEDGEGALWMATYGGGVNRLYHGRITPITAKNGLFDDFISRILVDDRDNFWMLGNRGIFRVNRRELNDLIAGQKKVIQCSSYGIADGMTVSEGNGGRYPAGWRMRDGTMWFPLIKGVAIIDPKRLDALSPPVSIEQALVNGEPMDIHQPIEISPEKQNLELQYTGLTLRNPEQIRFRYRLEGYDQDWVFADLRRTAFYTNLSPGRYVFRVRALSSDGVWSGTDATQEIIVLPPFWKTLWFRTVLGLLLAGSLIWALWWITSRYRRRVAQQEAFARRLIDSQEHERQRIAAELHDGLGQSLVIIGRRALLSLESIEDTEHVREQLKEIAEASAFALEEVREVIFDLRPQQLDRLGLTTAISDLLARVASVNNWSVEQHLVEMDNLFPKEVENSLYRIVQEVVNNISKHAGATQVSMEVRKETDRLEMSISDDGNGFKISPLDMSVSQSGLGLHTIYERSRLIGGEASIQSVPGKGTTVRVVLPLKRDRWGSRN